MSNYHLDAIWHDDDKAMEFILTNLTDKPITDFRLFYGSLTRTMTPSHCEGAQLLQRQANYHEYSPPDKFVLQPAGQWRFVERNLSRAAVHSNEGPKSAGLLLSDDTVQPVQCADLQCRVTPLTDVRNKAETAILPWPSNFEVRSWHGDKLFHLGLVGANAQELRTASDVVALTHRLFPLTPTPFVLAAAEGTPTLQCKFTPDHVPDGYLITFSADKITLHYGPGAGLLYGMITLAQMLRGGQEGSDFAFPRDGKIEDAPAFGWRGAHLDVSRQFYPITDVLRFVDIMAWQKQNRFHWHLTDDEGWRLEIKAYPALTDTAAYTGFDYPILPQLGSDPNGQGGYYTQDQARGVVDHAMRLGIEIMPEVDIPGHCACVLAALPELVDADEPESYWSIQGFPNNALNPGVEKTYEFITKLLGELCDVFPFQVIHIGGDEVADDAWLASPQTQALMQRENLTDTSALQAYFLNYVQQELNRLGRVTGGWEEAAQSGGVKPENALLFAWTKREKAAELAKTGYDVVSTPGQSYYLDMAQSADWHEPGASWAGFTSPQTTYTYDAQSEDVDLAQHLKGVQACIWSEHLTTKVRFNHMVFPRLSAIAEAGWTPGGQKNLQRFLNTSALMPRL